jgi:biopolymer transport protein ExbD
MRLARRTIKRARIEIIPMIDTIFFLLVFFMISTLSMSRYSGLPVNLPKAATGQQPASESAAVTITRRQSHIVSEFPAAFAPCSTATVGNAELLVLINADERVEHGLVVDGGRCAPGRGRQDGHRRQTQGQRQ